MTAEKSCQLHVRASVTTCPIRRTILGLPKASLQIVQRQVRDLVLDIVEIHNDHGELES